MTRILLLGYDPETVDFSDPALPPGMTAEKVHAGIAVALKQFAERGWEADVGFIRPDETAGPTVERQLASTSYDCVVIGAGVRLPPRRLALFESVINAVHKAAPGAAIAFNTRPDDSADAAARWLAVGKPDCIARRSRRDRWPRSALLGPALHGRRRNRWAAEQCVEADKRTIPSSVRACSLTQCSTCYERRMQTWRMNEGDDLLFSLVLRA